MATAAEWATGYARQARADSESWQAIESNDVVQPCHRMLFLQMACEKLCKARLVEGGTPSEALQRSHGYVANPLPSVIRTQLEFLGQDLRSKAGLLKFTRHIAAEIEVANPAVDRNGQHQITASTPGRTTHNTFIAPLTGRFPRSSDCALLGPTFVKVLRRPIARAVEELR